MDISLNSKPGIISNAISMKNNAWIHLAQQSCLFVTSVGTICFKAFLILHLKLFENLDKTKNFSSVKFCIWLNQKKIIYIIAKQAIDFRLVSDANEGFRSFYYITDSTDFGKPYKTLSAHARLPNLLNKV